MGPVFLNFVKWISGNIKIDFEINLDISEMNYFNETRYCGPLLQPWVLRFYILKYM